MKKTILSFLAAVGIIGSASAQLATSDTFGAGVNQFSLDFRTIGNVGNAADPLTGYGSVGYAYRIGTYSISQNQIDAATASGLQNVLAGASSGDQPAFGMTWYESAAFVNWLNVSKGFQPAYNLTWDGNTWTMALWIANDAGYDANNLYRNSLAKYFLPSENEFYKAAYGKNDGSGYYFYPTASDNAPDAVASGMQSGTAVYNGVASQPASVYLAGGLSSYGTMGQGGNICQWEETATDGVNDSASEDRGIRGCYWLNPAYDLQSSRRIIGSGSPRGDGLIGFRVASIDIASIPEPTTYALFGIGAIGLLMVLRRRKAL